MKGLIATSSVGGNESGNMEKSAVVAYVRKKLGRSEYLSTAVPISEATFQQYKYIIILMQIMGFFPLRVLKSQHGRLLKLSVVLVVYSYSLWSFILVMSYYGQVNDLFLKSSNLAGLRHNIDKTVYFFTVVSYSLVLFSGTFITSSKVLKFFSYVRCMNRVDFLISFSPSKADRNVPVAIGIVLVLYSIMLCALHSYLGYIRPGNVLSFYEITQRSAALHVLIIISNIVDCYNLLLALSFRRRVVRLNELLGDSKGATGVTPVLPRYSGKEGSLVALRDAYMSLSDASRLLNDLLGPNILLGMISIMLLMIVSPYYTITFLQSNADTVTKAFRVLIFVKTFGRVALVVEPWYSCLPEFENTKKMLCKLLESNQSRQQVKTFGEVLRLRPLKFHGCSYFGVNRFVYPSLINILTTCLVVLLQEAGSFTS